MGQILLMKIFSNFKRCCFLSIFKIIQKKLQDRFSAAQPLWGGRRGRVSKPLATNLCHLITSFIIFRFSFGFISSKTRRRAKSGGRARACLLKFVIFEFSGENSYFERIRMVRMVRSLADRTFQLRRVPLPPSAAASPLAPVLGDAATGAAKHERAGGRDAQSWKVRSARDRTIRTIRILSK